MRLLQVFSNNLRKYRNASGLSQEAFANKAGLHRTYISALERGKRSIALDNIEKIADALVAQKVSSPNNRIERP